MLRFLLLTIEGQGKCLFLGEKKKKKCHYFNTKKLIQPLDNQAAAYGLTIAHESHRHTWADKFASNPTPPGSKCSALSPLSDGRRCPLQPLGKGCRCPPAAPWCRMPLCPTIPHSACRDGTAGHIAGLGQQPSYLHVWFQSLLPRLSLEIIFSVQGRK